MPLLCRCKRHETNLTICNWIIIAINTIHTDKLLQFKKMSPLKLYEWWSYFVDSRSQLLHNPSLYQGMTKKDCQPRDRVHMSARDRVSWLSFYVIFLNIKEISLPPAPEIRIHLDNEQSRRYKTVPQNLKSFAVLLLLYFKQTVTVIFPLPSSYCSTGSDSHTHLCSLWGSN